MQRWIGSNANIKIAVALVFSVILAGTGFGLVHYIGNERKFDAIVLSEKFARPAPKANQVKIGMVGDSWLAGGRVSKALAAGLHEFGICATMSTSVNFGAKSRQIFRAMLTPSKDPSSSNRVLMDDGLDYLVIVAGVNDVAGHIGSDYYAHHMVCMIKTVQARGIQPVILELPQVDLARAPFQGPLSYLKGVMFHLLFDTGNDDPIREYRTALRQKLINEHLENVVFIPFTALANKAGDHPELYFNSLHFNEDGSQKLGILMAEYLARDYRIRWQSHTIGLDH